MPGSQSSCRPHHPYSVGSYLHSARSRELAGLLQHIEWLASLNAKIRHHLPPELASQCEVIEYNDKELILLANSPVWVARLRYAAADLKGRLAAAYGLRVPSVKVRVSPLSCSEPRRQRRAGPRLSAGNARLIRQTARAVKDKKLAAALCRLADHGRRAAD